MKIAIDISQITYQGTGVARYVEQLVSHIAQNDKDNNYILYGNSMRQKKILFDFVNRIREENSMFTSKIIGIPQTLADIMWNKLHIYSIEKIIGEVDVFHASDWVEPPTTRARKVTTIHDLLVFKYPSFFPSEIIDTQKRRISWVLSESQEIIVDSHATERDLIELFSYPQDKISVIYPGISTKFRKADKKQISAVMKKHKLEKPYILSVGTREPRKNVDKTIEAFESIKEKYDVDLVIVGKLGWGPDKRVFDDRVKLLGYVEDDDLPVLYAGASCFVYPSLYEGFGFPILEAMASGCPVVTSKGGSLPEVGGHEAVYVDPESSESISEGIKKILLGDNTKRISEGIKWARLFSWDKTAREVISVYKRVYKS